LIAHDGPAENPQQAWQRLFASKGEEGKGEQRVPGAMPTKLITALALMAIGATLSFVGGRWFVGIINIALMFGVWRGNESIRGLMIGLSWIGLILNAIVGALSVMAIATLSGLAFIALIAAGFGAAQCIFMIWCLAQPDVQRWMFNRSLKLV